MTPVEYLHRHISKPGLVALYRRADVMMVTPLRDGMNLVAHEFVLCQTAPGLPGRWRGSLLLSEFAGAAQVLPGALLVNPWNVDGVVERLGTALELDTPERRRRLETMAPRVEALDTRKWADGFLTRLGRYSLRDRRHPPPPGRRRAPSRRRLLRSVRRAPRSHDPARLRRDAPRARAASRPRGARRRRSARCFASSAALPATDVHIVSGRRRRNLEQWLGQLPVHLCAEHGYLARAPGGEWRTLVDLDLELDARRSSVSCARSRPTFPGAHVERKACSIAWHYREAEPEYGSWRAHELLNDLGQHLAGAPAEILQGHRVVEVRARGVDKGVYVRSIFPDGQGRRRGSSSASATTAPTTTSWTRCPAAPSPGTWAGSSRARGAASGPREHVHVVGPGEVRALLRELAAAVPIPGQARAAAS